MVIRDTPPMFTDNGGGYDMTPAGLLLLLGNMFYSDDPALTGDAKTRTGIFIDDVLQAALEGGFKHTDIFITMLTREHLSPGLSAMAQAASDAAGAQANSTAMNRWEFQGAQ